MNFKSSFSSVSGWERSFFGGYQRMIWDHPFIKLDFNVDIIASQELKKNFNYTADKVIKMYLLKLKELGLVKKLSCRIESRRDFFGNIKKYEVVSFNDPDVLEETCRNEQELAPLFQHCKKGILESFIEYQIPDEEENEGKSPSGKKDVEKENEEGSGKGDQDGDQEEDDEKDKENEDGDGDGDKDSDEDGDGDGEGDGEEIENEKRDIPINSSKINGKIQEMKRDEPFNQRINGFNGTPKFIPVKETKIPYVFSNEEIKNGENLVKLLDISFDPKSDVVRNLKAGKLDLSKIAEVPAGNISVYRQTVEDQDTKPFSVCILADMSGSMDGGDGKKRVQLTLLNSLYLGLSQILPPDKLYIYGHSGEYTPEIYTFYSPYEQDYEKRIDGYDEIRFCENYDGPVIEAIHERIRKSNEDRIIFISLTDGEPCGNDYGGEEDILDLKRILEKCRRDDFVTIGVGILADHVGRLYQYPIVVNDLSKMIKDVSNMINKVVRLEFK